MRKAADAFRSIGEVSKLIGVPPHVLRYWETQFPQLSPVKRADGRRYYRPEDLHLAAGLCELLREEGMTTRGAARLIAKDKGASLRARGLARLPERFRGEEEAASDTGNAPAAEPAPAGKAAGAGNGIADVPAEASPRKAEAEDAERTPPNEAPAPVATPPAEPEAAEAAMESPVEVPKPTSAPEDGLNAGRPSAAASDLPLFPGLALAAPPPGIWLPRLAAAVEGLRAMTPPRRVPVQMQHLRDRIAALIDPDA